MRSSLISTIPVHFPKIKVWPSRKIEPMALTRIPAPFDNLNFVFELKHDGFRSLAYIADGRCSLVSSRRSNYSERFYSLKTALAWKAKTAILDGELVSLDDERRDRWNLLLRRRPEPAFYAFDLLWLNGKDLRQLPLIERKKRLSQLTGESGCDHHLRVPYRNVRVRVVSGNLQKGFRRHHLQDEKRHIFSFRTMVEGFKPQLCAA
jgi:ATP-dependent DNA ligase